MSNTWRGWRVSRPMDAATAPPRIDLLADFSDAALTDGEVWVDVDNSSLNYKDALALTGKPGIVRAATLIAGIDVVGTVSASDSPDWERGDRVLVNGCGLGETHNGGLAQRARLRSEWLVPVPESMTQSQAAAIGTAGFTAMLAVLALERAGAKGEILVTGAVGGVGSIAIALLSALGNRVTAVTGRTGEHNYLRSLGASDIIDRATLAEPGKALQSTRWAGAVDAVGGDILANVLAQVQYGGTVAACGNAASSSSTVSMMPFILRAVNLAGINSVNTPRELRLQAWDRLSTDLDRDLLDSLTASVALADAVTTSANILAGTVRGRTVVDVNA